MRLRTGMRGTCQTCGGEIYFSEVRDAHDPWVHSDWTKHVVPGEPDWVGEGLLPAYDHPAEPVYATHIVTLRITTPLTYENANNIAITELLTAESDVVTNVRGTPKVNV